MAIFKCDHCGHSLQNVPDAHIGKKAKCPKCQSSSLVKKADLTAQKGVATAAASTSTGAAIPKAAQGAVFKCDQCGVLKPNLPPQYVGKSVKCPKCQTFSVIKAAPSSLFDNLPPAFQASSGTAASPTSKPAKAATSPVANSDSQTGQRPAKSAPISPKATPATSSPAKPATVTPSPAIPAPSSNLSFAEYLNQVATVSRQAKASKEANSAEVTSTKAKTPSKGLTNNFAQMAGHIDNWLTMFNKETSNRFSEFSESLSQVFGQPPTTEVKPAADSKPSTSTSAPPPAPPAKKAKSTPPPKLSETVASPAPVKQEAINDIEPLVKWFVNKGVKLEAVEADRDNSYFFEVALQLGDYHEALEKLIKQIRWSLTNRQKSNGKVALNLSSEPPAKVAIIRQFCSELYQRAFLTQKPRYPKNTTVILHLQNAPKVTQFFTGAWLEQFVFAKIISCFSQQSVNYSCLRSFLTLFPNHEGKFEADVFLLFKNVPLWIECKSGEFRKDIEKYSKIRAKLGLRKDNILLIALGISNKDAEGMTSMFEITVVNEQMFMPHIAKLFNLPLKT